MAFPTRIQRPKRTQTSLPHNCAFGPFSPMNGDFDDLASLFMSDIIHGHPLEMQNPQQASVKRESADSGSRFDQLVPSASTDDFNEFLNNNTFINSMNETAIPLQTGHNGNFGHSHYSGLGYAGFPSNVANYGNQMGHYFQHMPVLFGQQSGAAHSSTQTLGNQQDQTQLQQMQQMYELQQLQMRQSPHVLTQMNGAMAAGVVGGSDQEAMFSTLSFENSPAPESRPKSGKSERKRARARATIPGLPAPGSVPNSGPGTAGTARNSESSIEPAASRGSKKESGGRPFLEQRIQIRYRPHRLTRLLDLKESSPQQSYTLTDKNGSPVALQFLCFLTGKLLTNDFDNSIFLLMAENADPSKKHDAKIVSCYRRNMLQIMMNLRLSGFSSGEKLLRLQNDEHGYNVSRVVKWFKIQVLAVPSSDPNHSVPVLIRVPKDKDPSLKGDIAPVPINEPEHIVTLTNSDVENGAIDNYFSVRQLQFRKATPYNGKLTLQNYFQLKVQLKAIVADLYYDDFVDDFSATTQTTDRNEILLHEVTSEPIIVRGRNPLFYEDRNDILLGNRNPDLRASFETLRTYVDSEDEADDDNDEEPLSGETTGKAGEVSAPLVAASLTADAELEPEMEPEYPAGNDDSEVENDDSDKDETSDHENDGDEDVSSDVQETQRESHAKDLLGQQQNQPLSHSQPHANDPSASRETSVPRKSPNLNLSVDKGRYKYFPMSRIYYLPPINSVYFPHGAHQKIGREAPAQEVPRRRTSSNVYFR